MTPHFVGDISLSHKVLVWVGLGHRELNQQFRADVGGAVDSLLHDNEGQGQRGCTRGALLLLQAGTRARINKEVMPHIKVGVLVAGQRTGDLHRQRPQCGFPLAPWRVSWG